LRSGDTGGSLVQVEIADRSSCMCLGIPMKVVAVHGFLARSAWETHDLLLAQEGGA
jgi:hypothetical protein